MSNPNSPSTTVNSVNLNSSVPAIVKKMKPCHNHSSFKCEHYMRNCAIFPSCCPKETFSCRVCHNETKNHKLDRKKTKKVKCLVCETEQPVSNKCTACGVTFGKYFCEKCNLWDSTSGKDIFHCDECGICRIGKREDIIHCDQCCMCYHKAFFKTHKCRENQMKDDCSICGDSLFHSTKELRILPECGHALHSECFDQLCQHGDLRCPICRTYFFKLTPEMQSLVNQGYVIRSPPPPAPDQEASSDNEQSEETRRQRSDSTEDSSEELENNPNLTRVDMGRPQNSYEQEISPATIQPSVPSADHNLAEISRNVCDDVPLGSINETTETIEQPDYVIQITLDDSREETNAEVDRIEPSGL
eukprot:UN25760